MDSERIWTAALVVIGDEILSGRTQDKNVAQLATWLNDHGIRLAEVRVVPDDIERIGEAVNALRAKHDYLFTTGGIGPTHDDITADSIAKADIVITTAQIPGRKAPILITEEMMKAMRPGSVIIDIAAATGGNTPFTKNNETVQHNGVTIVGNSSLPSSMPSDASKLYGKNILNFLQLITTKEGGLNLNWQDDLVQGSCVTHNGAIVHERVKTINQ